MRLPALKRLRPVWAGRTGTRWLTRGRAGAGLLAALSFWAGHSLDRWTGAPTPPPVTPMVTQTTTRTTAQAPAHGPAPEKQARTHTRAPLQPGPVYVRRGGSVLRDGAKWSAHTRARKDKGAVVTLLEAPDNGWARVRDGDTLGWMRASVLGMEAP